RTNSHSYSEDPPSVFREDKITVGRTRGQFFDIARAIVKVPLVVVERGERAANVKKEWRVRAKKNLARPDDVESDLDRLPRHEAGIDVHPGIMLCHHDPGGGPPGVEVVEDEVHVVKLLDERGVELSRPVVGLGVGADR